MACNGGGHDVENGSYFALKLIELGCDFYKKDKVSLNHISHFRNVVLLIASICNICAHYVYVYFVCINYTYCMQFGRTPLHEVAYWGSFKAVIDCVYVQQKKNNTEVDSVLLTDEVYM